MASQSTNTPSYLAARINANRTTIQTPMETGVQVRMSLVHLLTIYGPFPTFFANWGRYKVHKLCLIAGGQQPTRPVRISTPTSQSIMGLGTKLPPGEAEKLMNIIM